MKVKKVTKSKRLFLAMGVLVVAISVMIFSGVGASLWGVELHSLEQEIAEVEKTNRELEDEIVKHTSLTKLYDNLDSGFIQPENMVYLDNQATVLGYAKQ